MPFPLPLFDINHLAHLQQPYSHGQTLHLCIFFLSICLPLIHIYTNGIGWLQMENCVVCITIYTTNGSFSFLVSTRSADANERKKPKSILHTVNWILNVDCAKSSTVFDAFSFLHFLLCVYFLLFCVAHLKRDNWQRPSHYNWSQVLIYTRGNSMLKQLIMEIENLLFT